MAKHVRPQRDFLPLSSKDAKKRSKSVYVHEVKPHPHTTSRESSPTFERRVKHGSYVEELARSRRKKIVFTVILIAIVAVAVALAVGVYTFFKTSDNNLVLVDDDLRSRLTAVSDGDPEFILCTADLNDRTAADKRANNDAYVLVKIDVNSPSIVYVTIPTFLPMGFGDEQLTLAEAALTKSPGDIVSAIAKFCDVEISHYVTTDAECISEGMDLLDGVDVFIDQEIDDPMAGIYVFAVGDAHLDSNNVMTFLRATNLQGGFEATAFNRMDFMEAAFSKIISNKGLELAGFISNAGKLISTDLTTSQILSLGDAFRNAESISVTKRIVPYTSNGSAPNTNVTYSLDSSKWSELMESIRSGNATDADDPTENSVSPSEVSVEVKNGANLDGAASRLASMLKEIGYVITGTGNVEDQITYPETLVVYTDPAYADAAKAIVLEMGIGRVVNGGDFYTSDADIIAIIGTDWSS